MPATSRDLLVESHLNNINKGSKNQIRKKNGVNFISREKIPVPTFFSKDQLLSLNLSAHADKIFKKIQEKEEFLRLLLSSFKKARKLDLRSFSSADCQLFYDKNLINPISPYSISQLRGLRIAAVDGGLGFRQYLGVQLTLIKVTVVLYDFNAFDGTPSIINFPPIYNDEYYSLYSDDLPISENSGKSLAGLRRTLAENSMLLNFLRSESTPPDLVLLDGSLTPPPMIISQKNSHIINQFYRACVKSYKDLYEFCIKHNIILIGSVKDSRSTMFRDLLNRSLPFLISHNSELGDLHKTPYRKQLKYFTDSELVFKLIPTKKRSSVFFIDSSFLENLNEKKTKNQKIGILGSYIQISPYDIPIRFEFLSKMDPEYVKNRIDLISNILYPISFINPECTIPLPQIEAHLRAHLPDSEIELITNQLESQFQIKHISSLEKKTNKFHDLHFKSFFGTFLSKRHEKLDKMF